MEQNLEKAINYLENSNRQQLTSANIYTDKTCKQLLRKTSIIMPATFALYALQSAVKKGIKVKKNRIRELVDIIKRQNNSYSFNFTILNSAIYKKFPLPDDLDDTALCLSALLSAGEDIHERFFVKVLHLEIKPGGPYRTWYIKPEQDHKHLWQDIDPVVNANFLHFAALFGIKLAGTRRYLIASIKANNIKSPYYPVDLVFHFYAARYVHAAKDKELAKLLQIEIAKVTFSNLSKTDKLLYLLVQSYLGMDLEQKNLEEVVAWQEKDGSLPELLFSLEFLYQKKSSFAASKIVATALFVELLALNLKLISKRQRNEWQTLQAQLKRQLKLEIKPLNKNDFRRFVEIPIGLAADLVMRPQEIQLQFLKKICLALYFSNAGYTILDKIYDRQSSKKHAQSAEKLIKLGWEYFLQAAKQQPKLKANMFNAFASTKKTYAWETTHARFTKANLQKKLSQKWNYSYIGKRIKPYLAAVHAITEFITADIKLAKSVANFFTAIVNIDQINDDAHDWQEDYQGGILTYVLYLLLKDSKHAGGEPGNKLDSETLQKVFWRKTVLSVIAVCQKEYHKAQHLLENNRYRNLRQVLAKSIAPIRLVKQERAKVLRLVKYLKKQEDKGN